MAFCSTPTSSECCCSSQSSKCSKPLYNFVSGANRCAKVFSDLSNAFFSMPVHPDSPFWFAINFDSKSYTFTRLCQGYCESSTIYNQELKSLEPLVLTQDTALLQYVDDLIWVLQVSNVKNTLLKHLAAEGHKATLSNLQFVQQVTLLCHVIQLCNFWSLTKCTGSW